jgi:hypothetical protein
MQALFQPKEREEENEELSDLLATLWDEDIAEFQTKLERNCR